MPTDYSLEVRRSIVTHLKAFAPLTGLVSVASIYPEETPAEPRWPFIRYGVPLVGQFEATGWDGSEQEVTLHAFANGPGMDLASRIAKQVTEAMKSWTPPAGTGIAAAEWVDTQFLRDGPPEEASKYHAVIRFNVAVTA
jgi:hypothetical protein